MTDAKKVIKGLENCIATSDSVCPDDCPYYSICWDSRKGGELLYYSLMKDALEVIKAECGKDITPDKETAITHLQIISTWAGFALEKDMNFFTKKHLQDIEAWTKDAAELLKEQQKQRFFVDSDGKITPLPIQPQWISVKDNRPKDQKPVIVYVPPHTNIYGDEFIGYVGMAYYTYSVNGGYWCGTDGNVYGAIGMIATPSHWMPRPEPPKEEK